MSDEFEDIGRVRRLALFPLPLVLLPAEPLPLHIFENRYRAMLADAQEADGRIGIVLFAGDENGPDRPPTGSIGCIAKIRDVETLADGRSNIFTQGEVRFRIVEYLESESSYAVAEVEIFHDDADDSERLRETSADVMELFERVAKAAYRLGGERGILPELQQTDPETLSFLVAAGLSFQVELKQELVEMTSTFERLERLKVILSTTVDKLEERADIQTAAKTNGHSRKKLDL